MESAAAALVLFAILLLNTSCGTFGQAQGSPTKPSSQIAVAASLPSALVGSAFEAQVDASGGVPPYKYTASGSLPPGVKLNQVTGALSGVPTTAGTYAFTVEVTDSTTGNHGGSQFSLPVSHPANHVSVAVSPTTVTIAAGAAQQFNVAVINASNSAVTWSATEGSVSSSGKYTAPDVSATSSATVTATSVADSSVRAVATITITPLAKGTPLVVNTRAVPSPRAGAAYDTSLAASGGKTPYQWTFISGSLPNGIALNKSGVLSGTANQTGQFSFNVQVTDSSVPALTAQGTLSLAVIPVSHVIINALFPPMGSGNSMWNAFNTYVLSSPYLDGVNPGLDWNSIETSEGVYDFTQFDASLQHFYDAGKTVNLIVRPVSNGGVNSLTPSYVFSSRWASSVGATPLDVVTCKGYPGNGQSRSGFPVVYELPFKVAFKKFIAAVFAHYANNSHIGYIRVGLSVGGEVFPWCSAEIPSFSQNTWLGYIDEMNAYERSLNPNVQLMAALNQVYTNGSWDQSYTTAEARSAVANGQGIGSQGWQESDLASFRAGLPCASDWCMLFDQYAGQVPLELQQAGQSVANGGTTTGSMADIIPFAVAHHTSVLEIYIEDLLTAFDPSWPAYSRYGPAYREAMVTAHGPK